VAIALSPKTFSVSAPSAWNALSHDSLGSARQLIPTKHAKRLNCSTSHTLNSALTSLHHHALPICLRHIGAIEIDSLIVVCPLYVCLLKGLTVRLGSVACCVAIWKVIRSWLTSEQRDKTILVSRQDMSKYIAADQLEEHMVAAPAV